MQKALTHLTHQHPSEDDRFATCGWLATSICWEALKNSNNSLKTGLEKTDAGYGMEISADGSKILVNTIKASPATNIWMGKRWKKWTSSNSEDPYKPKTEHLQRKKRSDRRKHTQP